MADPKEVAVTCASSGGERGDERESTGVLVEERCFAEVEPGWVVWDQNGSWREVERRGDDWVHEESGASGPTLLLRLAPSATIQMTGARTSVVLCRVSDAALTTERHRAKGLQSQLRNARKQSSNREKKRRRAAEARAEQVERERDAALDEITRTVNEYEKRTEVRERELERLREALRESDDMLRGWLVQMADDPAYKGMALSTDAILSRHAALTTPQEESET